MKTKWTSENIASQAGRRVVITGANSGIGFEAALELARKGAELILPARTQSKAEDAVSRILQQVPQARLYPQCQLRRARFRGTDKNEFLDQRQLHGHAFDLLSEAMQFSYRASAGRRPH